MGERHRERREAGGALQVRKCRPTRKAGEENTDPCPRPGGVGSLRVQRGARRDDAGLPQLTGKEERAVLFKI